MWISFFRIDYRFIIPVKCRCIEESFPLECIMRGNIEVKKEIFLAMVDKS